MSWIFAWFVVAACVVGPKGEIHALRAGPYPSEMVASIVATYLHYEAACEPQRPEKLLRSAEATFITVVRPERWQNIRLGDGITSEYLVELGVPIDDSP